MVGWSYDVAFRSAKQRLFAKQITTLLEINSRGGEAIEQTMDPIVAGLREGEFYRDHNTPADSWTFTGSKGLRVTQSFDPDQVDFTCLYAYPADLNELEVEVSSAKAVTPQPGEATRFSHELEVRRVGE